MYSFGKVTKKEQKILQLLKITNSTVELFKLLKKKKKEKMMSLHEIAVQLLKICSKSVFTVW